MTSGIEGSDASAPASQPAHERMFTQQEVANLVSAERKKALERAAAPQAQEPAVDASRYVPVEKVAELVRNETKTELDKQRQEWAINNQKQQIALQAQKIEGDFDVAVKAAKAKYADFDEVADTDLKQYPEIMLALDGMEGAEDLIYTLGQKPGKVGSLRNLALTDIKKELKKLSASLKVNEDAPNARKANPPLSQLKPSTAGAGKRDFKSMSLAELRASPEYRA